MDQQQRNELGSYDDDVLWLRLVQQSLYDIPYLTIGVITG